LDQTIDKFIEDLASESPAPGGGAVSALAGALGVALASMVANLTLGKEKFKAEEHLMQEILQGAKTLQTELTALIEEDSQAYNKVTAVFAMPKATEDQKAARKKALQEALKYATHVPFTVMEKAAEALRLHRKGMSHTNPSAASDTGVGALCLKTALMGAHLNVKINLGGITDKAFTAEYEKKAASLLEEGTALADNIYKHILDNL